MNATIQLANGLSLVAADGPASGAGSNGAGGNGHGAAGAAARAPAFPTLRLQRGLLLFDGAADLAEEGVGFGVPVLKRGVEALFPGSVDLAVHEEGDATVVRAVFRVDLVERLRTADGQTVGPRVLYGAKDALAAVHRRVPASRGLLTAVSSALRDRFAWRTTYVPAGVAVSVPVTSRVDRGRGTVQVAVDLAGLPAWVTEAALMNEQGARAFDRYEEAGAALCGDAIGAWDEVGAPGARFVCSSHDVVFSLAPADGATLRRGRELVGDRLSWAGFGLTVPAGRRSLAYELRVGRLP